MRGADIGKDLLASQIVLETWLVGNENGGGKMLNDLGVTHGLLHIQVQAGKELGLLKV